MSDYDKSMPVMVDVTLESEEKSQLIGDSSVNIKFSQDIVAFEIANNSENATIYLKIDGTAASTSTGIPIYPGGFYGATKKVLQDTGISLISNIAGTDVRIVGHYNLESELK